ncbi:MAG: hypothetical protein ABJM58_08680 [Alteripontixanthobacter sp.]
MKFMLPKLAFASLATIAVAACGGEVEETETTETEVVAPVGEFDPMTREYELSEDAATRRAEFDEDAFTTEYDGYRGDIAAEPDDQGVIEANNARVEVTTTNGETSATVNGEPARPIGKRSPDSNMRDRGDMNWGYLDRNNDNQLSVAEYAIWAIPLDPNAKAKNDQGQPELTSDQINKAADSFFYYDTDGDTYLSRQEFSNARLGRNIG